MPAYFTPDLFRFLTRLKRNNKRDWFLAHKDQYEACAHQPALRFSHRGKDVHSPGFYLHLEAGGCFAASGLWHPEPPTLLKVRNAIVERCDEWRPIRKLLNWDDAS